MILCADGGMVSENILRSLAKEQVTYIVGSRWTKAAKSVLADRRRMWQELEDLPIRIKFGRVGNPSAPTTASASPAPRPRSSVRCQGRVTFDPLEPVGK